MYDLSIGKFTNERSQIMSSFIAGFIGTNTATNIVEYYMNEENAANNTSEYYPAMIPVNAEFADAKTVTTKCGVLNGTYGCELIEGHDGQHYGHHYAYGVKRPHRFVDKWSSVHFPNPDGWQH